MTRCNECNSVVTRTDAECYICGVPVPGVKKASWRRRKEPKPPPPVTPLSNLIFMASLALTLVSFLSSETMSVSCSATLSGILLVARIGSDRMAARQRVQAGQRLALRPVAVARLYR
jgi:hypothetical protein